MDVINKQQVTYKPSVQLLFLGLMISSNEIGKNKNQRLTKYQFNKVKKETEKYVIDKYPELEQDILINAQKEKQKDDLSKKYWEVK